MNATKVGRFREQVKRFRTRFAQGCASALGSLLGQSELEDWLVRAGSGVSAPAQTLRYIRWRRGGTRYEVLTNVPKSLADCHQQL